MTKPLTATGVAKMRPGKERLEIRDAFLDETPTAVMIRQPKGGKRSLREISAELAAAGHTTWSGKPYAATAIKLMLENGRWRQPCVQTRS